MKEKLFILVLLFSFFNSLGQTKSKIKPLNVVELKSGSYEFTQSLPKEFISLKQFGTKNKEGFDLKKGRKIDYLYSLNGKAYFKYWKFTKDSLRSKLNSDGTNDYVFEMDLEEFEKLVKPLYRRYKGMEVGAYTIPFRLRGAGGGDNFDFESSLSIQANLVAGFGSIYTKESWFDLSLGLGLTEVNLNSNNSNVTEDRTASAFTYSAGAVFKASKYANLGIFFGVDNLGRNDTEVDWKYDGRIWMGLGINVSFNGISTTSAASQKERDSNDE